MFFVYYWYDSSVLSSPVFWLGAGQKPVPVSRRLRDHRRLGLLAPGAARGPGVPGAERPGALGPEAVGRSRYRWALGPPARCQLLSRFLFGGVCLGPPARCQQTPPFQETGEKLALGDLDKRPQTRNGREVGTGGPRQTPPKKKRERSWHPAGGPRQTPPNKNGERSWHCWGPRQTPPNKKRERSWHWGT